LHENHCLHQAKWTTTFPDVRNLIQLEKV